MICSLYQRATSAAELKCTPNLARVAVDLDDELDLQCRNCLGVVASLQSVDHFMRLCKGEEKHGSCFLVLKRKDYNNLLTSQDMVLFEEEPFESIYLREVTCFNCNNSLGTYFQTVNCDGTAWLLHRIALNLEELSLFSSERNMLESLKNELQKLIPFKCHNFERVNEGFIAEEQMVTLLLKTAVDPSYPQNRAKHSIVQQFINVLEEHDKNMSLLEKRGCVVAENAEKYLDLYMRLFPQLKKQAREKDLMKRN